MSLSGAVGANYLTVDSTQKFDLGERYYDKGVQAEFIYIQATSAIAQYDLVQLDNTRAGVSMTTTTASTIPASAGVAQVAIAASSYGWVLIRGGKTGKGLKVNAATLCVLNAKLYTTATAGVVDDTATKIVSGLVLTATNSAGGTVATECIAVTYLSINSDT
jgi:hypothetical protein